MRWYADNSELTGLRGAPISDILLFGGVAVPDDSVSFLKAAVEAEKAKFADSRAPIKWNIKDLKQHYERIAFVRPYKAFLANSKELRTNIFKAASGIDFSIIISVVEAYQTTREGIKQVRPNLARYAFSNGLMRFALHAKAASALGAQVILDWPDGGDFEPYTKEYAFAYCLGTSPDSLPYYSGALRKLAFSDSVMFTTMHNSTLLQFADLVLGATREFVECAIGKRKPGSLGFDLIKSVRHRFYGYPKRVFGRGLSVASGNETLAKAVREWTEREMHGAP